MTYPICEKVADVFWGCLLSLDWLGIESILNWIKFLLNIANTALSVINFEKFLWFLIYFFFFFRIKRVTFHVKNGCKNACGVATSGHDGTGTKKRRSSKKWFLTIKKVRKSFIFDLNIILANLCSKICPILRTFLYNCSLLGPFENTCTLLFSAKWH